MSDFSFLALPNVQGMRLGWYIRVFGIVIFFGVCLFSLVYFLLIYHRKQVVIRQLDDFDYHTHNFGKQLLYQKIQKTSGKAKIILFIEYLEKFVTTKAYVNLSDLLLSQGRTQKEANECEQVIYADKKLSKSMENKIDHYFTL